MSATTIESDRIAGALKCLDMLRQLEQTTGNKAGGYSPAIYAARCLSDARSIINVLGPMTPKQEGFITCLIEYAQEVIEFDSPCVKEGWRGYSAMLAEERQSIVEEQDAEFWAEYKAEDAARTNACKVVSIADWRAAP